jgi:subtilisin family serine protease
MSRILKLDPLLLLASKKFPLEKIEDLRPSEAPAALGAFPLGLHSLARQMSEPSLTEFLDTDLVPVLVDTDKPEDSSLDVEMLGGTSARIGATTLHCRIPRANLEKLAALSYVRYVEANVKLKPHCDLAHISTRLWKDGFRSTSLRGAGVIVGVVDTGIDTQHRAFQKDGKTRILNYLDQTIKNEYDEKDINEGKAANSPDQIGHGTHVAGIAAGTGDGSPNNAYQGVAPDADLAIVKTTFDSTDIAAGVAHIFDFAAKLNRACVVNLSLGGHVGPHDGTTVVERIIDQLSGPGKLVVVSAGNEGDDPIHAGTVLAGSGSSPARWVADFQIATQIMNGQQVGYTVLQVWYQNEDDLVVRLRTPNGEEFLLEDLTSQEYDRQVFVVQASHQRSVYTRDHCITFVILTLPTSQWLRGWSIIVEEDLREGKHGAVVGPLHCWIADRSMGAFTSNSTSSHLVGMPGTSYSAITVASYATRKAWTSRDPSRPQIDLTATNLEDISYFSSPGPTRDGDTKPEIAAPGQWLVSALSSNADPNEMPLWLRLPNIEYAALQGTSMAAPYVTGALALLLEKDRTIDWGEAKRRLVKSTKQDSHTKTCWNSRWGYGKIDVDRLLTLEPSWEIT